jgi:RNA polymerase sigma-70 factor (ECF subfamily)
MDQKVFSNNILILADQLFRMAKSILLDEEDAKDCVQELYMKLWEKRNQLHKINNLTSFVMKSMRNLCLDKLRKKREIDLKISENEMKSDNISLQEVFEQKDMTKVIKQYINQLPELQRTIIRLRDVEGFEIKEIAYITASNENAVTVNLSRARQKIREHLIMLDVNI